MANIVVSIHSANVVKVEFNDYYQNGSDVKIAYYNRNDIEKIEVFSDKVKVHILGGVKDWELSYTTSGSTFVVDEVNGVTTINSNEHLAQLISDLIVA